MATYRTWYSTWRHRIIPILEISGWELQEIDAKTYFVNGSIGYRFEYRYYGNCAPIWLGELEVVE